MYACLFQDNSINKIHPDTLDEKRHVLGKIRKEYKDEHGQNPVPAVLVALGLKSA